MKINVVENSTPFSQSSYIRTITVWHKEIKNSRLSFYSGKEQSHIVDVYIYGPEEVDVLLNVWNIKPTIIAFLQKKEQEFISLCMNNMGRAVAVDLHEMRILTAADFTFRYPTRPDSLFINYGDTLNIYTLHPPLNSTSNGFNFLVLTTKVANTIVKSMGFATEFGHNFVRDLINADLLIDYTDINAIALTDFANELSFTRPGKSDRLINLLKR